MLYDLLHMDLRGFNVRDQRRELIVPKLCHRHIPSNVFVVYN
jgi:hypothetical protein